MSQGHVNELGLSPTAKPPGHEAPDLAVASEAAATLAHARASAHKTLREEQNISESADKPRKDKAERKENCDRNRHRSNHPLCNAYAIAASNADKTPVTNKQSKRKGDDGRDATFKLKFARELPRTCDWPPAGPGQQAGRTRSSTASSPSALKTPCTSRATMRSDVRT